MFPKKNRITEKEDFDRIFRSGRAMHSGLFVMKMSKNDLEHNRFGVVVSTKISGKATERNRIKRQIRNSLTSARVPNKGMDVVIYAKKSIKEAKFEEINQNISEMIKKL